VQRSFFSKRNFAAEAERPSAFDFFDVGTDLLSIFAEEEARSKPVVWERGFAPLGTGQSPVTT
jgi:hypothetical protein